MVQMVDMTSITLKPLCVGYTTNSERYRLPLKSHIPWSRKALIEEYTRF